MIHLTREQAEFVACLLRMHYGPYPAHQELKYDPDLVEKARAVGIALKEEIDRQLMAETPTISYLRSLDAKASEMFATSTQGRSDYLESLVNWKGVAAIAMDQWLATHGKGKLE